MQMLATFVQGEFSSAWPCRTVYSFLSNKKICIEKLEFRYVKVCLTCTHLENLIQQNRLALQKDELGFFVALWTEFHLPWKKVFA